MNAKVRGYQPDGDQSCPKCRSQEIWRHGKNGAGNQQYLCRTCKRVFVAEPYLRTDIKTIADRMIKNDIPVPTITMVLDGFVSRRWLYSRRRFING